MALRIVAFRVSPRYGTSAELEWPSAPELFAKLTGIRSTSPGLFEERGRLASASASAHEAWDLEMVFGESHVDRDELGRALAAWHETRPELRRPFEKTLAELAEDERVAFGFTG
jgi:hypothetical protein